VIASAKGGFKGKDWSERDWFIKAMNGEMNVAPAFAARSA
jgi:hypothetical protein